ncbi:MAG: hypothetical protein LH702_08530 [Phormidesmis sp. CAN_BIN44]|nr:hypothetical protein [Phormidesmis sp. CAN_BIN44]
MNRLRASLMIALSTTILSGALLGSVRAEPCSFSKSNPTAVSPSGSFDSPSDSTRPERSTTSDPEIIQANSMTEMKIAGAGFAVFAGVFTFGLMQRVRRFKQADSAVREVLNHYPEAEHPELMLTSVPKEAYSSRLENKQTSVR